MKNNNEDDEGFKTLQVEHNELRDRFEKSKKELKSYKNDNKKLYDELKRISKSTADPTASLANFNVIEDKLVQLTKEKKLIENLLNRYYLFIYNKHNV